MRSTALVTVFLTVILLGNSLVKAKDWHGLVPLQSTRADVERLLGSPVDPSGSLYETKNEKIFVWYADKPCKKGISELWNVPKDTVLSITIYPKKKMLFSDLDVRQNKYKRVRENHVTDIVYYADDEAGIKIEVNASTGEVESVNSITYGPTAKDSYLRCPHSSIPQESKPDKEYFISKFDEYSELAFEDEKARLDNFAIYLQKDEPAFKGYIIVYVGRSTSAGVAQARAKRAKDYLVKVRGIEAGRIVTIDGGCRDRLEVELYALPATISPPTPNPYRNK